MMHLFTIKERKKKSSTNNLNRFEAMPFIYRIFHNLTSEFWS